MKLNYKRTILVGFAFFLISAFWQAYDAIVPLILENHYGLTSDWSGAVMSLDNILAVFLLPLFGGISDKINSKWGKRTPFIFIGTIFAIFFFVMLALADNAQMANITSMTDIPVRYQEAILERESAYNALSEALKAENADLIATCRANIEAIDNEFVAITVAAFAVTASKIMPLICFVVLLLFVLFSMAIFRSPAVALMPDVTVKPLRSKGNAIINLMGTAGGMIVLVLGIVFNTKQVYMNYTPYICLVCAVMAAGLIVFLFTVKEKQWADEMAIDSLAIEEKVEEKTEPARKLSKSEMVSLILILASVALWYIGYNSVTSKYSVYATRELGFDYNLTLIIAQAAAVVSYIPVGIISSKLGRKKTILIGVSMLATAFLLGNFITPITPEFLMYPIFVLAGIGWATINVNSFPMVVELAKGGEVGKYTGYYYTASMAAQIVAPTLSGILYKQFGMRNVFFAFATVFVVFSFITMLFVKHGDAKAEKVDALEALAGADD